LDGPVAAAIAGSPSARTIMAPMTYVRMRVLSSRFFPGTPPPPVTFRTGRASSRSIACDDCVLHVGAIARRPVRGDERNVKPPVARVEAHVVAEKEARRYRELRHRVDKRCEAQA